MIQLSDILQIENLIDFKVHFARWNGDSQPLEVLARDQGEWIGWQEYYPGRNGFNRPHIFALAQIWYETDAWMFGGVFDIIDRLPDKYVVRPSELGRGMIGRLKLASGYRGRTTRTNLENHYETFEVIEILRSAYSGRPFPGFDLIDVSFDELETIVRNGRIDWKSSLENIKGVYLITDRCTGKRYVGSAYGEGGVWSRWCGYIYSGHGGNAELRALVTNPDLDYCRSNFQFCLLEAISSKNTDEKVLGRESYWKIALFSRGPAGLNRN